MMESIAESISNHEADQSAQFQQGKFVKPIGGMVLHTLPNQTSANRGPIPSFNKKRLDLALVGFSNLEVQEG